MGIFGRRREPDVALDLRESWQPDGSPMVVGASAVDNDDAAGPVAYGAGFTLGIAPGASITIWAYPVACPPGHPGDFAISYACQYRCKTAGGELWVAWQSDTDPEWYYDLANCDAACRDVAQTLATTPRIGESVDDLQFFDWDGVPV
jgi:hypothetical protein